MSQFLTDLETTPLPDGVNHRLTAPLKFVDDDGVLYTVPVGFITDFASIPPLTRIGGYITLGGLVLLDITHGWPLTILAHVVLATGLFVVLISDQLNCDDQIDAPATLHDYGYRVARGNKLKWDALLFSALTAANRPAWKCWLITLNVILFGWGAWRGDAKK
jgi:hypothetical protein